MSNGVQRVLDDPASQTKVLVNRHVGEVPLPEAISKFFTVDVQTKMLAFIGRDSR